MSDELELATEEEETGGGGVEPPTLEDAEDECRDVDDAEDELGNTQHTTLKPHVLPPGNVPPKPRQTNLFKHTSPGKHTVAGGGVGPPAEDVGGENGGGTGPPEEADELLLLLLDELFDELLLLLLLDAFED